MGLITDFVVKPPKAKFIITVALDVILIGALLFFAFKIKGEYQKGFDNCWNQACAICSAQSYSGLQNFSMGNKTPINFTIGIDK